jgi:CheY-like chemotaxis protein
MGGSRARARILTIDDDASVRELLTAILTGAGFTVAQAPGGERGLQDMRAARPDLVIVDLQMPGIDGHEVCRRMKADPELRDIPIIMCTGDNRKEMLVQAIRLGAADFIIKPFTAETVVKRVQRVLTESTLPFTPPPSVGPELRQAARRGTRWKASWSAPQLPHFQAVYKCRVLDISVRGMALEFPRCATCTGYEQGGVHPLCLFAPVSRRAPAGHVLDFILSISNDIVLEVRGRIAHVYQPADTPATERVGVEFVDLSRECATVIDQYVVGALNL